MFDVLSATQGVSLVVNEKLNLVLATQEVSGGQMTAGHWCANLQMIRDG